LLPGLWSPEWGKKRQQSVIDRQEKSRKSHWETLPIDNASWVSSSRLDKTIREAVRRAPYSNVCATAPTRTHVLEVKDDGDDHKLSGILVTFETSSRHSKALAERQLDT